MRHNKTYVITDVHEDGSLSIQPMDDTPFYERPSWTQDYATVTFGPRQGHVIEVQLAGVTDRTSTTDEQEMGT